MSTHSQFKKFNILQELEQAIKKKTQEKYNPNRSKSRTKYALFHKDPPKISSNLSQSNRQELISNIPSLLSPEKLPTRLLSPLRSPNSSNWGLK